jgi:hypothetical protein
MWEPRRLTTLWASTACYRDSFFILLYLNLRYYPGHCLRRLRKNIKNLSVPAENLPSHLPNTDQRRQCLSQLKGWSWSQFICNNRTNECLKSDFTRQSEWCWRLENCKNTVTILVTTDGVWITHQQTDRVLTCPAYNISAWTA